MTSTWLITGSSRGFGWELAKAALGRGDNLVATVRHPDQLDPLVKAYSESVRKVALDVTDAASARAAVRTAVDNFGSLDVVVNNAGYANSAPIEEMSDDDFRAQIETNLFGCSTSPRPPFLSCTNSAPVTSSNFHRSVAESADLPV